MQMDRLYPPGKVWWAVGENSGTASTSENSDTIENVSLYEVLDVEKVFGQVVYARDMLRHVLMHVLKG
jgi:sn1-specific diacylglycerol lipase